MTQTEKNKVNKQSASGRTKNHAIDGRTFGVEIEFNGTDRHIVADGVRHDTGIVVDVQGYNHRTHRNWKAVTDATVNGGEFVSPILGGSEDKEIEAINGIHALTDAMTKHGATVARNTGLHVHFDARDLNVKQVQTIAKFWCKYEDVFDALVAGSRRGSNNGMCKSNLRKVVGGRIDDGWKARAKAVNKAFDKINACKTVGGVISLMSGGGDRFTKFNMVAFFSHGTFEVRSHGGTLSADKIELWIRTIGAMFTLARKGQRITKLDPEKEQNPKTRFRYFIQSLVSGMVRRNLRKRLNTLNPGYRNAPQYMNGTQA